MLTKDQAASPSIRPIETPDDLDEARLEATGYIFHGAIPQPDAKRTAIKANTNLRIALRVQDTGDSKDVIDVAGQPTRGGSRATDPAPAAADSPAVRRLRGWLG